MENGRYGYRESVSSPISHADFIEKAPDRNSEWQKQKEDDDYFLDEEEDIQEENRDFGNEDTWKDPSGNCKSGSKRTGTMPDFRREGKRVQ